MNKPTTYNIIIVITLVIILGTITWYFQSKDSTNLTVTSTDSTTEVATDTDTDKKEIIEAVIEKSGDTGDCPAESDWFPHDSTERTNDAAFSSSSNCEFHQWAWQNFLWLTQDVDGEPRFMSFASPESLIGQERPGMLPRMTKSNNSESFDEFLQAGTDGIFIAHNGRSVYYSQYLDETFVGFVEKNNLTDPSALQDLVKTDPSTSFPIENTSGAMELKASWMIVEPGDDVSDMFTTQTQVAKLANQNGTIVIDTSQVETVTVALVGFHIAGVVAGHPEMIWATFEHVRNAPNVPTDLPLEDVVSKDDFTFYTANTTLADCNVNYTSSNQLVLNEATQELSPISQACRFYQYGNASGVNTINDKNIADLNTSVDALFDNSDIWKNYQEVGAIWFKGENNLKPGMSLATDTLLSGSLSLSNSTIETFTQVASTENNCFRCHNTKQELPPQPGLEPLPASNLNISHALLNIYFWSQEDTDQAKQTTGDK
jgi:hypothetical protein